MTLKELRKSKKLTQADCANYLGIPLRTYQNYENDKNKIGTIKYNYLFGELEKFGEFDETHGVLTQSQIKEICGNIFDKSDVSYCYLFGSYAKGKATEKSDIDLLISTSVTGIGFYDLTENLRENLKKQVELLNYTQLNNNPDLLNEILKDGIKIYG